MFCIVIFVIIWVGYADVGIDMFNWLYQGFGYVLRFCNLITDNNYAFALLLLAIIIKVVLFPFGIKQQKNMVKQARLRPREMAIRKKYAGRNDKATQQKAQEEIMNLYQEENFNPMGGCLPMLIQLPILWALFRVITAPLTYICRFSADTIAALTEKVNEIVAAGGIELANTSNYSAEITLITHMKELGLDKFSGIEGFDASVIPNFELFGGKLNLAYTPNIKEFSLLLIIPVVTLIVSFFSARLTKKFSYQAPTAEDAATNSTMKIMEWSMPLMSVYISFIAPAAIGLYWIYQNIFSALQQFILYKLFPIPKFTDADYKAAEKAVLDEKKAKKKASSGGNPNVRSLHHIDDDEFEEIYGKKNKDIKKNELAPEVKEESGSKEKASEENEKAKDIPVIKNDDKTNYKKKDE